MTIISTNFKSLNFCTGVTLPIFEHFLDGSDSKYNSNTETKNDPVCVWITVVYIIYNIYDTGHSYVL